MRDDKYFKFIIFYTGFKLYLSLLLEPKHNRAVRSGWCCAALPPDWSPASHCHAVNLHHMVRPLGLLTEELEEQVYRVVFQSRGGQSCSERTHSHTHTHVKRARARERETRSTCRHFCLFGHDFFLLASSSQETGQHLYLCESWRCLVNSSFFECACE